MTKTNDNDACTCGHWYDCHVEQAEDKVTFPCLHDGCECEDFEHVEIKGEK